VSWNHAGYGSLSGVRLTSVIPQRITMTGCTATPAYPEECEPHTDSPAGYLQWSEWADRMRATCTQRQCRGCGLWAVWEPRKPAAPTGRRG